MIGTGYSAVESQNSLEMEAANALFLMEALADESVAADENFALLPEYDKMDVKRRNEERQAAMLRAALTQAHRANESLRDGMTALIETSAQPTFVLNRDGIVTVWNRAMHTLTGFSGGQAFGHTLAELFVAESLAPLLVAIAEILVAGSFPGGLESSAPHRLPKTLSLAPASVPVTITLLPVCLLSGCLDTLIVLCETAEK